MNHSFNLRGDRGAKNSFDGSMEKVDHTCTKKHPNGMVKKWPFYGVFCDLQLGDEKSPGHQMFVLLCLQNQKTVALLPKSLLLDPRFPVFLQGFLASCPPWWNQNCQRQTSKKSAKKHRNRARFHPPERMVPKTCRFVTWINYPFFAGYIRREISRLAIKQHVAIPPFKNKPSFKKKPGDWSSFFFGALWGDGIKTSPKKRTYRKKNC